MEYWGVEDDNTQNATRVALTTELASRAGVWRMINQHLNIDPLVSHNAIAGKNDGKTVNITALNKIAQAAGGELVFQIKNSDGEILDLKEIFKL